VFCIDATPHFTGPAWRSNAVDDGREWFPFMRPIKNHAVAKRQAFEAITWLTVPLASVHVGGGDGNLKLKSVAIMPIKLTNRN
jgi:hypothetical protein